MSMIDHGNVTGNVSVDASSAKVHHFTLVDDSAVIGEPSDCFDGDEVTFIFTAPGFSSHTATWDFITNVESPNPNQGQPHKVQVMKFGSKWV
jgi:hypothetical protein